jgi:AraC-like DNA-binding protein
MNPHVLKVLPNHDHSFSVRKDVVPYFLNRWHCHPELELLFIESGTGTQFIGDHIQRFQSGDVLLVGSNLPHYWRCDDHYFEKDSTLTASAIVSHFRPNFWGNDFLELAENKKLKQLFEKAQRGIALSGQLKKKVISKMTDLLSASGTERIILLLQILNEIAGGKNLQQLCSCGFNPTGEIKDSERINTIYTYSLANFKEKIYLDEVARQANISPNSFCRFFKSHTRKTYNTFLQELRVGHASRMLIENKKNITQICYDSGFNNLTNFYKSFKKITGKTPFEYQKTFLADVMI